MKVFHSLAAVFIFIQCACGGGGLGSSSQASIIEFTPNPAPLVGGVCSSQGILIDLSSRNTLLVSLQAVFTDQTNAQMNFVLDANELSAVVDAQVVPANGIAQLSLAFDLGSGGLVSPITGTVSVIGVSNTEAITFVGSLECEN